MRRYLRFSAAGMQLAISMTLFTLGGVWLDGKFERVAPLFTVLGAFLGMAVGMTGLIVQVLSQRKR